MKKTRRIVWLAAGAISAAMVTAAVAQGMGPGGGMGRGGGMGMGGMGMGPVAKLCAAELDKHCSGQRGPQARACLEAKEDELSEDCRVALESTGPDRSPGAGPVARLCMVEIDKFCTGVEHVAGRVRTCLDKHRGELSNACTTALDTTGRGWRRMQQQQQQN